LFLLFVELGAGKIDPDPSRHVAAVVIALTQESIVVDFNQALLFALCPGQVDDVRPPIRPVTWEEWITLPIRDQDEAVHTVRGQIRVPTVIVAVNYAKVPKKRPKLCARAIRERDGNRCQYTGRVLHPDEGSLDHVVPRSRGGKDAWENLVWSAKEVNQRKADRLPHEAGLKLLSVPRAPKELPISALIRNPGENGDWKLFLT
jgi:5-methylcytosine-specific restriction endonuclease McrA